jgi:hypothetical protein
MTKLFLLSVLYAQIAQLVEQRTENPRVAGSIPALGTNTCGINSVVECHLAKVKVASPNLVSRSKKAHRALFFAPLPVSRVDIGRAIVLSYTGHKRYGAIAKR